MSWPKSSGPVDLKTGLGAALIIRNSGGIITERNMVLVISIVILKIQAQCLAFIYVYCLFWLPIEVCTSQTCVLLLSAYFWVSLWPLLLPRS